MEDLLNSHCETVYLSVALEGSGKSRLVKTFPRFLLNEFYDILFNIDKKMPGGGSCHRPPDQACNIPVNILKGNIRRFSSCPKLLRKSTRKSARARQW